MEKRQRLGKALAFADYVRLRARHKREMGKEGTAELYEVTGRHWERFLGGRVCRLREITGTLIMDFACFLQKKGLKTNSINSYLSCLRAVYNAARAEGVLSSRENPFARLRLRREITAKRAISHTVIRKMAERDWSDNPTLEQAADLSIFSFSAFGMPFVDLVHLRKSDIRDGEILYRRRKTGTEIRIGITPGMNMLIKKYKNDTPYVFPLKQERSLGLGRGGYKSLLARQNQALREIGGRLGLATKLTSYVMRHSWASEALARHVPVAVISQAMGHASEKTTRCYLKALDRSELDKANKQITNFLDNILVRKRTLFAK